MSNVAFPSPPSRPPFTNAPYPPSSHPPSSSFRPASHNAAGPGTGGGGGSGGTDGGTGDGGGVQPPPPPPPPPPVQETEESLATHATYVDLSNFASLHWVGDDNLLNGPTEQSKTLELGWLLPGDPVNRVKQLVVVDALTLATAQPLFTNSANIKPVQDGWRDLGGSFYKIIPLVSGQFNVLDQVFRLRRDDLTEEGKTRGGDLRVRIITLDDKYESILQAVTGFDDPAQYILQGLTSRVTTPAGATIQKSFSVLPPPDEPEPTVVALRASDGQTSDLGGWVDPATSFGVRLSLYGATHLISANANLINFKLRDGASPDGVISITGSSVIHSATTSGHVDFLVHLNCNTAALPPSLNSTPVNFTVYASLDAPLRLDHVEIQGEVSFTAAFHPTAGQDPATAENQDLSTARGDDPRHEHTAVLRTGPVSVYWKKNDSNEQKLTLTREEVEVNQPTNAEARTLVLKTLGSDSTEPFAVVRLSIPVEWWVPDSQAGLTAGAVFGGLRNYRVEVPNSTLGKEVTFHVKPSALQSWTSDNKTNIYSAVFGVTADADRNASPLHMSVEVHWSATDPDPPGTEVKFQLSTSEMESLGFRPGFAAELLQLFRNTRVPELQRAIYARVLVMMYAFGDAGDLKFAGQADAAAQQADQKNPISVFMALDEVWKILSGLTSSTVSLLPSSLSTLLSGVFGASPSEGAFLENLKENTGRVGPNEIGQAIWNAMASEDQRALNTIINLPIQAIQAIYEAEKQDTTAVAIGGAVAGAITGGLFGGRNGAAAGASAGSAIARIFGANVNRFNLLQGARYGIRTILELYDKVFSSELGAIFRSQFALTLADNLATLHATLRVWSGKLLLWQEKAAEEARSIRFGGSSTAFLFPRGFQTAEERGEDVSQIAAGLQPTRPVGDPTRGSFPPDPNSLATGAGVYNPSGQGGPGPSGNTPLGIPSGSNSGSTFYQSHPLLHPSNVDMKFQGVPESSLRHTDRNLPPVARFLQSQGLQHHHMDVEQFFETHQDLPGRVGYISEDSVLGTRPSHFHTPKVQSEGFELLRSANEAIERLREGALDRKVLEMQHKKRKAIEAGLQHLATAAAKKHKGQFISRDNRRLFKTPGQRQPFTEVTLIPTHPSPAGVRDYTKAFFHV